MTGHALDHRGFAFGDFVLDLERCELLRDGAAVHLRPKSFDVLRVLVQRHGRVVTRQELLDEVWSDVVVTEESVAKCLIDIRRAIEDPHQQLIRTVPRRGYLFDAPVRETGAEVAPAPATALPASEAVPRRWPIVVAVAGVLAIGGAFALRSSPAPDASVPAEATAPAAQSLAVLPFVDLSPGKDQEYLGDGFAEEILNVLAQGQTVPVIARTSSFSFKSGDADISDIAARLNVTHVLEGSVRKEGDRLRITAQLVEAPSGLHLWSESYDRNLDDVFALQSEIASIVAAALQTTLNTDRPAAAATPDAHAWEQYLLGRYLFNRRRAGDLERAEAAYRKAIEIDPAFARGWAGLAGVYSLQFREHDSPPDALLEATDHAADEALRLDPRLAEAYARRADVRWVRGNVAAAHEDLHRAFAFEPDNPLVLAILGGSAMMEDRLDDAIELQRRAVARDPMSVATRHNFGIALFMAGSFGPAEEEFRTALRIAGASPPARGGPDHGLALDVAKSLLARGRFPEALAYDEQWLADEYRDFALALVHHALGNRSESDAALARLLATGDVDPFHGHRVVEAHAYRGEPEAAFEWLATLVEERIPPRLRGTHWKMELIYSPFAASLHDDPRWQAWCATGG